MADLPEPPVASPAADRAKPVMLRWRLFVLAASGLVPLAIMVAIALTYLVREREEATQRSALALSRALATAVDAELRSTAAILRALSQNDDLQRGELQRFYDAAAKLAQQQGWRSVVLADDSGKALFRTHAPFGAGSPRPVDPESMTQALANGSFVVGSVKESLAGPAGLAFAVRLPVQVQGSRTFVLSAVLTTDQMLNVLKRQSVPANWVVGVFDQKGRRVARSMENAITRPSPTFQALLDQARPEGVGLTRTLEDVEVYTGYTRLADSGWVIAVAIPAAEAIDASYGPLAAVLVGLAASLGLAAWLGGFFARKVSEPIDVLKHAAAALGRGEQVQPEPLPIAELDDVGRALARASREREAFMQQLTHGQAEREALLRQVTQALGAAEEAGRIKDEFMAVLGHELRNPLAPISMALQLMSIKGDQATAEERRVIERQLAHMTRLVDDLLDLSRITGKRLTMHLAPVRLVDVIEHAADAIRPLLDGRTLRIEIAEGADQAWVSGDEARLGQVLHNLLGNALKFTANHDEIVLALALAADGVEAQVRDNGAGMSAEVLQHAFEPFYQERQSEERSRGGLGLGLAIVKNVVEMHGGSVTAHSEGPGRGSRVVLRLPLVPAPESANTERDSQRTVGNGKVLVVDDNRDAADVTAALLEISGYELQVAYEPAAALALLDGFVPDVAVLDIGLPGMSGYELAQRVRSHPNGSRCKLIALTGYGQEQDIARALHTGFDMHLVKPVPPDLLLERVAQLVANRTLQAVPL